MEDKVIQAPAVLPPNATECLFGRLVAHSNDRVGSRVSGLPKKPKHLVVHSSVNILSPPCFCSESIRAQSLIVFHGYNFARPQLYFFLVKKDPIEMDNLIADPGYEAYAPSLKSRENCISNPRFERPPAASGKQHLELLDIRSGCLIDYQVHLGRYLPQRLGQILLVKMPQAEGS